MALGDYRIGIGHLGIIEGPPFRLYIVTPVITSFGSSRFIKSSCGVLHN